MVSSGADVHDLIGHHRHQHLFGNPTVGEMRNAGCQAARGEIIAHFDDDDYSAPWRLREQAQRLTAPGIEVTGYRTMRFTDGAKWWLYVGAPNYALGTSLMFKRSWWKSHQFPALRVGEDGEFVRRAATVLSTAEAGETMFATVHEGNTSPRRIQGKQWQVIEG